MRKRVFYPKLAAGNLWRNRKTYAPYLLACVVSIFTFYTLLAINLNGALDGIRGESIVKAFTAVGTVILGIFCGILIFYTNSFLIKRRKKELGLYSILGMEKKNIALVMLFETAFVAGVALFMGIALGLLLSRLLFWMLLSMIRFPVMMNMGFSLPAVLITCALFGVFFLLAFLTNLLQVRLSNPVALLSGAKQGEREPKASWLITFIGVLCLSGGYYTAVYPKDPATALMAFLLAVFLVIIGTYCLFNAGSIMLLKMLRKNKKYYYQPNHFISVSGLIYRMKQNAAGLATICILSCMVLVTVSSTVSLNVGAEASLSAQYPYEYEISYKTSADPGIFYAEAERVARENGVSLTNLTRYEYASMLLFEEDGAFVTRNLTDENYSDANLLTLVTPDGGTAVAEGLAQLLVTGGRYDKSEIKINGLTYNIVNLEKFGKVKYGQSDLNRGFLMVLPSRAHAEALLATDKIEDDTPSARFTQMLAFDIDGEEQALQNFRTAYGSFISGVRRDESINGLIYHNKEEGRYDWYATNGGFLFLGIYFGVLFLLAAVMIIYYKQLSEGYDDAERFEILQKVGMGEQEVKRTINRQILTVFFAPLLVALAHVSVAFVPISRVMVIFGAINTPLLLAATGCTALVYIAVYLLVFRRTAKTYFGIVKRRG